MDLPALKSRKPPMTRNEAIENVATMRRETPVNAQKKLFEMALGRFGNLSDEAREIYQARLEELN